MTMPAKKADNQSSISLTDEEEALRRAMANSNLQNLEQWTGSGVTSGWRACLPDYCRTNGGRDEEKLGDYDRGSGFDR
jgi:hypothetical protein